MISSFRDFCLILTFEDFFWFRQLYEGMVSSAVMAIVPGILSSVLCMCTFLSLMITMFVISDDYNFMFVDPETLFFSQKLHIIIKIGSSLKSF